MSLPVLLYCQPEINSLNIEFITLIHDLPHQRFFPHEQLKLQLLIFSINFQFFFLRFPEVKATKQATNKNTTFIFSKQ